jgi:hypothetical protein
MPPDEPNDEERLEELPGDEGQTPFQPADPPRDPAAPADDSSQSGTPIDTTHPVTDTDVDAEEAYDAGLEEATGASEPNKGNAVVDYEKPEEIQPS